MHLRMA